MSAAQELLRECSSFYINNESDPWEMLFPIIPSINGETFTAIIRILKHQVRNPSQKTAAIILGEAGFGKTHMIGRIRRQCETSDVSAFFSNIRPIIDDTSPMRHLVKGIITSLAHDIEGTTGYTQIHRLVSEVILEYYREKVKEHSREEKRLYEIRKQRFFFFRQYRDGQTRADILRDPVSDWICRKDCTINPHFIRLLFAFCNPDLRSIAFQALTGNTADKEDAEKLGIPFREEPAESTLEEEARDFIISLGLILARYGHVLLVCFDQLENIHQKDHIFAFGLMILTIVNECKAMLPLAMSRTLHWYEVIRPELEQSVIERLSSHEFILHGCSDTEVEEIVQSRLKTCMEDGWKETYQWLSARMKERLNPSPSPREVLSLAYRIIVSGEQEIGNAEPIPRLTPLEAIATAFRNERDQILSDMDSWPPDHGELTEAISLYLTAKNVSFTQERLARKTIVKIDQERPVCLVVNTNQNHNAVGAAFAYGTEQLANNPGSSCMYLTDPRCPVTRPNWRVADEKREAFMAAGGVIYQPAAGDIAWFYALYSLHCRITEGDLLLETGSGVRSITPDELSVFISEQDTPVIPLFPPAGSNPDQDIPAVNNADLSDRLILAAICEILNTAPMHMMLSTTIAESLNRQNIQISHDHLLTWCGDHKESFLVFRSPRGSTIMLKGMTALCQA